MVRSHDLDASFLSRTVMTVDVIRVAAAHETRLADRRFMPTFRGLAKKYSDTKSRQAY